VIWFDDESWRLDSNPQVRTAVRNMLTTFG
jgi:hypothetical protein